MRIADTGPLVTRVVFHPFVFGVFPVLSFYVNNLSMASALESLRAAAFALVCAMMLWWLVNLVVKHRAKSATIVSVFFVLLFAYGGTTFALNSTMIWLRWLDRAEFLLNAALSEALWLGAWGALLGAVFLVVARQSSDLRTATGFLNIAALALLMVLGVRFVMGAGDLLEKPHIQDAWQQASLLPSMTSKPDELPDIYYIIVDAYGRADVLEEVYGFDNSDMLAQLTNRGFYVADRSRANYAQTTLSLASSLNFGYLNNLLGTLDTVEDSRIPMQIMIEENRLVRFLRQHGYTIVEFESGYQYTQIEHDVHMTAFPGWSPSQFEEGLILMTPLSALRATWADYRRQRIEYALEHLADPAQDSRPTFTFAHILAPHSPFLFDAEGNAILPRGRDSHAPVTDEEFAEYYSAHLLYVNKRLVSAIDAILSQSTEHPIIVVQADHGPDTSIRGDMPWEEVVRERMPILNAIYLPDAAYEHLYEDITPVNTFRLLLKQYLGADLALLDDRCFYSFYSKPYAFTDVTDLTSQ